MTLQKGICWRIVVGNIYRPFFITQPNGYWSKLLDHAKEFKNFNFPKHDQSEEHWKSWCFLVANWSVISRLFNEPKQLTYPQNCYPEVVFPDPQDN